MSSNLKIIVILVALSFIFLMLGNGVLSLTNPDEVFYTQTAREMVQQKSWMVPYLFGQPQFEKPILTFWLLRIGFILFGVTSFSARFFPAFFGIIGSIAIYLLVMLAYKDKKKAFISALVMMSSGLYVGLSRTVFTDMVFSVFILLSLVTFFWAYVDINKKSFGIILFFIFSGLAVLTKGPLGFFIPLLIIILFLGIRKDLKFLFCKYSLWGSFIFIAIALPWYVFMLNKFGNSFIHEFFYNDHIRRLFEAEHRTNDTWFFYPLSMVACMFPWSVFVIAGFSCIKGKLKQEDSRRLYLFLCCWIFIVFAIFQMAHSKLVSYIFPLFPALAIIAGDFIYRAMNSGKKVIFIFFLVSWAILIFMPIGLIVSSLIYSAYLPSKAIVYIYVVLYIALLIAMLIFILKKRILTAIYLLAFQVPFLIFFMLSVHKNFEVYVSSKSGCEYLINNYETGETILSAKFFARGIRFYTDKDIVVIGNKYFSPHPILCLDSHEKIRDYLKTKAIIYGILNKSSFGDVQRLTNEGFRVELLKVIGDEYIVRIISNSPL